MGVQFSPKTQAGQLARLKALLNADADKNYRVRLAVKNTSTACTAKNQDGTWDVILPAAFDVTDPENADIVLGMVIHEDGHHLFTDTALYEKAMNEQHGHILVKLLNAFDDIQQEHRKRDHRPGDSFMLSKMYDGLVKCGFYRVGGEAIGLAMMAAFYTGHYLTNGYRAFEALAKEQNMLLRSELGETLAEKVLDIARQTPSLTSTADALRLARKLLQLLLDAQPKPDDQDGNDSDDTSQDDHNDSEPNGSEASDSSNGGSSDTTPDDAKADDDSSSDDKSDSRAAGDSDDSDSESDDGTQPQSGSGEAGDGESGDDSSGSGSGSSADNNASENGEGSNSGESTAGNGSNAPSSAPSSNGEASGDSLSDKVAEAMQRQLDGQASASSMPSLDAGEKIGEAIRQRVAESNRGASGPDFLMPSTDITAADMTHASGRGGFLDSARAKQASSGLSSSLRKLLASEDRVHKTYRENGKRIARRKAAKILTGDTRVFVKKRQAEAANTAVAIALDCSYSMDELLPGHEQGELSRQIVANETAYALACAIESIHGNKTALYSFANTAYLRKRFSQKAHTSEASFALSPSGGTAVDTALQPAFYALMKQPQRRKVMILVTDGDTGSTERCRAIVNAMYAFGIDTYAVAIGDAMFATAYVPKENVVEVQDVRSLKKAMFELAKKALISPPRG